MGTENPTFQIPKDVIEPIIQAQVAAGVAAALGDYNTIIEQAVAFVLTQKVDDAGKPSNYSYSVTYLQWLMDNCIRKSAKAAIEEVMTKHQDAIKATLAKQLTRHNSPLAKQLVNGLLGALTTPDTLKYRINITHEGR